MKSKYAVVKIIPPFFVVEKPEEKSKDRHVNKQYFGEIMKKGFSEFIYYFFGAVIFSYRQYLFYNRIFETAVLVFFFSEFLYRIQFPDGLDSEIKWFFLLSINFFSLISSFLDGI